MCILHAHFLWTLAEQQWAVGWLWPHSSRMHPLELQRDTVARSWAVNDHEQTGLPACLGLWYKRDTSLCYSNCCLILLEKLNLWLCLYRKLAPGEECYCHKPEICVIDSEGGLADSEIKAICACNGLLGDTEYCFNRLSNYTRARKSQLNSPGEMWKRQIWLKLRWRHLLVHITEMMDG